MVNREKYHKRTKKSIREENSLNEISEISFESAKLAIEFYKQLKEELKTYKHPKLEKMYKNLGLTLEVLKLNSTKQLHEDIKKKIETQEQGTELYELSFIIQEGISNPESELVSDEVFSKAIIEFAYLTQGEDGKAIQTLVLEEGINFEDLEKIYITMGV